MARALKPRGLTLLEVILAMVVTSTALIAIFTLFPGAMLTLRRTEVDVKAHHLADNLLEEKRAIPYDDLEIGVETPPPERVGAITLTPTVEVRDGPTEASLEVRASVSWEYRNRTYTVVRSVLVCDAPR